MKNISTGSRLVLAFVLFSACTGCSSLMAQNASEVTATATEVRPGSSITRYPVKMRQLRSVPSLSAQEKRSSK